MISPAMRARLSSDPALRARVRDAPRATRFAIRVRGVEARADAFLAALATQLDGPVA